MPSALHLNSKWGVALVFVMLGAMAGWMRFQMWDLQHQAAFESRQFGEKMQRRDVQIRSLRQDIRGIAERLAASEAMLKTYWDGAKSTRKRFNRAAKELNTLKGAFSVVEKRVSTLTVELYNVRQTLTPTVDQQIQARLSR